MVPQILPRSLDAQQNDAVDRSHPPRSTNITNRAGISTQDPLSAGIIKPSNHVGTAPGGVLVLCRPCVGFRLALSLFYCTFIQHSLCGTFYVQPSQNLFQKVFFRKPFSEAFFRRPFSEGLCQKAFVRKAFRTTIKNVSAATPGSSFRHS